eukprot:Gregarina_sp_Poly_1__3318@NODE_1955_length_3001_cov_133_145535_g1258_i0_p2_GENE_NODE_1955_length_3001_cov_133_145535_g1258_i0NODE_1955_length_3001_cov_133_145535_g1258_i0_p2_ORF_typecomplete_len264_score36_30_NODE_1955_length_3001_cov_133_145535_g1258_i012632054
MTKSEILEHLKPYKWTNTLPEQTITIVSNKNIKHPKELIELIQDYNHIAFDYQQGISKTFEDIFNTHDDYFFVACKEVAPHVYVLLEHNGYYASQEENMQRLCEVGEKDEVAVAVSLFWNVNAHYRVMIATSGKCILNVDPFDLNGPDMLLYNEADEQQFKDHWRWGMDAFESGMFQNMDHIIPGMFWLAQRVTEYEVPESLYSETFDHIGMIGQRKKRRTICGSPKTLMKSLSEPSSALSTSLESEQPLVLQGNDEKEWTRH